MDQNTGPNLILVKTALDKLFDEATIEQAVTGKALATDAVVFTQDSADNAAVVSTVMGGGGYFDKTLNDVGLNKNATVNSPAPKTTLIAQFKKDLPISRTFMADQQLSAVSKAVQQSAMQWTSTQDRNAFAVYNNGFTTQTTIDNVALFSNSHINLNGDTVDNLETGALSADNLWTVVQSLANQKAQDGEAGSYVFEGILTPFVLYRTTKETLDSELIPFSGENQINFFDTVFGTARIAASIFLGSTYNSNSNANTSYHVLSSSHAIQRKVFMGLSTDLIDPTKSANDSWAYRARFLERHFPESWNGYVGSNGTA